MPRRRLSPEEEELWRRVASTAAPLRAQSLATPDPPGSAAPFPAAAGAARADPVLRRAGPEPARLAARPAGAGRTSLDLAPDPQAALAHPHPHMDRRRFERLRRGRIDPEARLDLHGMTLERAHAALTGFVASAHAGGLRLVLVITGKGREGEGIAPHRRGVLRHAVPHWLAAPPLASKVLQLAPAHIRHGGAGAYYVYLRRTRP